MSIRLIAIDLDGTLLDEDHRVSAHTCETVQAAAAQGVTVTLATGRMFCSALKYAEQLDLDAPLITYNGSMIKSSRSGREFLHHKVPLATAEAVLELCRSEGWYVQDYIDDVLYVKELDSYAREYEHVAGVAAEPVGEALYAPQAAPTKLLSIGRPEDVEPRQALLRARFGSQLYITSSKPGYVEIMNPVVNKGQALAVLAAALGIAQKDIMAVGDSNNDIDMLSYAGLGVAMGNAADCVKAAADAVTGRNVDDGVAQAIAEYVLK